MYRKMSLQLKTVILVSAVTIAMMSVIVGFDSYSLQKSVEETYISQLHGITTAINGRYEESHSIEDVQQIFDYIQYKEENVLQLTLFGKEEVLASNDRDLIGQPSPEGLLQSLEASSVLVSPIQRDAGGISKVRLTAPLKEDGVTVGAIELLLNASENTALIQNRIRLIIAVGVSATALLLAVLSFIIRKLLIKPLMTIREAAVSVKHGSGYKEIQLNASQEINEVASAFNDMVHNLEERYRELQNAVETIQHAQKQLVESEKMVALGNLVAGVSHEINTPIGIGVTAVSYLDEKTKAFSALYRENKMKRSDLEEYLHKVRDTAGMIQTNLLRASELVKSFKQVAVDRSMEAKRKFRVKEYIQEVLISLKPQIKKTKHQVELHGNDNFEVFSDPGAVSQIITNLIMNSIIHAYDEEDQGRMRIDIVEQANRLVIKYSDDGRGMPEQVRSRIFEPFFTTNRGGGGTGLGMHIVYNLVTQSLGGTIVCDSKAGHGTSFTIHIPLQEGEGNG
ncbi:sensor histidine kinase [Paenibacillus alkalitolerans]|uniref:sensor histidine kinase n=1 Tax=Paenibacillus alkalitolerans TaxID=2799335 RepID=UPI0018F62E46|nr:HAMP domain-containing sensor histidine kinase [Paenibacillus alkalitolerans]